VVGWRRIVVFAVAWTAMEWLRGVLLTGFPWNPLAITLDFSDAAIQLAAVLGEYGLGFVVALCCAAPAVLADPLPAHRWRTVGLAAGLLAALWAGGALRLSGASPATVPGVVLRIVQGDIPQRLKWDPELRDRNLAHYLRLSQRPAGPAGAPTDLIWPEAAVPVLFDHDAPRRRAASAVVPKDGLLLTGAIRTTVPGAGPFEAWNSLEAIDGAARIVASYDKFHLVPFGEYLPLRPLLSRIGLDAVAADRADFTPGPGPRTLTLPGLPAVSPLICYEAIFPGTVADPAHRPGWLLNVTNDAWFGNSAGPYQHFAIARLRAVEEGLPLARAANTGISAVVDAYGRVIARLGLGREGVLDSPLPVALPPTPFARFGSAPLAALLILAAGAALFRRRPAP
jgi:apolipoprotein N-acyltransferase